MRASSSFRQTGAGNDTFHVSRSSWKWDTGGARVAGEGGVERPEEEKGRRDGVIPLYIFSLLTLPGPSTGSECEISCNKVGADVLGVLNM